MNDPIEINLKGAISEKMNPLFRKLVYSKERVIVLIGGASSSKSYSTAQKIIYKVLSEPGHKFLVIRKVASTNRHSTFDLLLSIITEWHMLSLFKVYLSEISLICKANKNEILFVGLDDVEKLKSMHGITSIWVEEASEITEAEFNQLDLRIRGVTKHKKQIILTLNPITVNHWIKKRFFDRKEESCITHHSTYKDNLALDSDTIRRLESITDPYFRTVYVLGEWGVFGNAVFSNYVIDEFNYDDSSLENSSVGIDFGFVHASALIRVGFLNDELYIFDELFGKGWTNPDFIAYIKEKYGSDSCYWHIIADGAEPDRIMEFERAGFIDIRKAKKGAGSVRFGIDFLCSRKIHIHATKCPNMAREIASFKRREDKEGAVLDAFVDINDDCIAALRYAVEPLWNNKDSVWMPPEYALSDIGL
jgi:phage terminase large subunit